MIRALAKAQEKLEAGAVALHPKAFFLQ